MATCNYCGTKAVRWVLMQESKNLNLLDESPSSFGDIAVIAGPAGSKPPHVGIAFRREELVKYRDAGTPLYTSHFATCPKGELRKRLTARAAQKQKLAPWEAPADDDVEGNPV